MSNTTLINAGGRALMAAASQLRLHVPAARYHASPGLSISKLGRLAKSPQHFQHQPESETIPMRLGTAAHMAVLEPERFARDVVIWDRVSENGNHCPRRGKFWDAFKAEHATATIVDPDDYEHALAIQHAVRTDKWASKYLQRGAAEVSMHWTMRGRLCRGRPDYWSIVNGQSHLVGLKTAVDARPWQFSSAGERYGYHLSWAWYHDGFDLIRDVRPIMKEIVVESGPPYSVVVYDIPPEVIDQGREEYSRLLDLLADCEGRNLWPGPSMGMELVYSRPAWTQTQTDDDLTAIGLEV